MSHTWFFTDSFSDLDFPLVFIHVMIFLLVQMIMNKELLNDA